MQKYTDNANGDAPLTVENVQVSLSSRCAASFLLGKRASHFLLGRKTKVINCFLCKKYFHSMTAMQINRDHTGKYVINKVFIK